MTEAAERRMDFSLERQSFVHTLKPKKKPSFCDVNTGFPAKWREKGA